MQFFDVESAILAQVGDLLVVNKPAGWPTSGRTLDDPECVQFQLIKALGRHVWTVHQLDKDTSGLCFFALSKKLVAVLQARWSDPAMEKSYLCIAEGEPAWEQWEETAPIGEISEGCLGVSSSGKSAHTCFEVLDRQGGFSLLRARLRTGRTHQIRIHLGHLGFPLVGEGWYRATPCERHPRQALHAWRVRFPEGVPLDRLTWEAPLAADWVELADKLGLRWREATARAEG